MTSIRRQIKILPPRQQGRPAANTKQNTITSDLRRQEVNLNGDMHGKKKNMSREKEI